MEILVINVSLRPESPVKLFPIGLGYVTTAIKRAGYDFDLIDIDAHRFSEQAVEQMIRRKCYDVVFMGCIVTGYGKVKSLAGKIKEIHPQAKIIVGNSVATSVHETLLLKTRVDIAVIGEGDETVVDILDALASGRSQHEVQGICFIEAGKVVQTLPRSPLGDISSLPLIDYTLWDTEIYIANTPQIVKDPLPFPRETARALCVNTARGCIAKCTFCYHVFKEYPYRYRTPESVVDEIKTLQKHYDLNYIHFWDELTFFSKKQTWAMVQKILDEGLRFGWAANCRADLFDEGDFDLLKKIKAAGCLALSYSLESSDPAILQSMNKNITVEQFSRQTRLIQEAGICTYTSLVVGYPQETPETIKATFDCCAENQIYPSAGYLLPQPGSVMYDYARGHGFIPDEEAYLLAMGDRQDLRLNMTKMSDQELEICVKEGLRRCNEGLNIGLTEETLIKSQFYRFNKEQARVA